MATTDLIEELAEKALREDSHWAESAMGPIASLVHKYYVRGFIAGFFEAKDQAERKLWVDRK